MREVKSQRKTFKPFYPTLIYEIREDLKFFFCRFDNFLFGAFVFDQLF